MIKQMRRILGRKILGLEAEREAEKKKRLVEQLAKRREQVSRLKKKLDAQSRNRAAMHDSPASREPLFHTTPPSVEASADKGVTGKHHIIISGTGRAGTTFLVQLLTELGLDTGFADTTSGLYSNCNAGMEFDLRRPDAPYIVKSPFLCDYLDEVVQGGGTSIEHAIIPVRDLYSAAQSRRDVTNKTKQPGYTGGVPGGLWHTEKPEDQEVVLAQQLYKLIAAIAKHDIPMTLLSFPRFVYEPYYLYQKIPFALNNTDYDSFLQAFETVSRPELVHDYKAQRALNPGPMNKRLRG